MMNRLRSALVLLLAAAGAEAQVSTEVIGWTTRDRQVYGPALRYLVNDTLSGLHAVWKDDFSAIRYNFRPSGGEWRWPEGTVVSPWPRNLGCLDVSRSGGRAFISADFLQRGYPELSYLADTASGCGVFVERNFASGARDNLVACASYGSPKFAALRRDTLYYRSSFSSFRIGHVGPFPAHNLAVSKQAGRFGFIWAATSGPDKGKLFLKETPNHGANWYATHSLSDSVPTALNSSLLGACATYDSIRIHLVADLCDGSNRYRVQLWHYSPYDAPAWSLIHDHASPDSPPLGDQALVACRPSIGIDRRRLHSDLIQLCVVWEQFDPQNIDPRTGLARADIWACRSADNGRDWGAPVRLTQPDSTSKRFPFVAEVVGDTFYVLYFADRIAGFWEQGQGDSTRNPVVLLSAPVEVLPAALAEPDPARPRLPCATATLLAGTAEVLVNPDAIRLSLLDASGRLVRSFAPRHPPRAIRLPDLPPGVYFLREESPAGPRCRRLVNVR